MVTQVYYESSIVIESWVPLEGSITAKCSSLRDLILLLDPD